MGGGAMSPAVAAGGGGGMSCAQGQFQCCEPVSVLSRVPLRPPLTESGGLAEACLENLHCMGKRWYFDSGFGSNPSEMEVESALSDFQRYMHGKTRPQFDGHQQMFSHNDSGMLQGPAFGGLHRAFNLYKKDPSVQSMVKSICCDKAVWDAIMNNKAVQDLHGSLAAAKEEKAERNIEEPDVVHFIVKWIMEFTKSKVVELMERFLVLVAEIFLPAEKDKPTSDFTDLVEEKIRSSLLLSVIYHLDCGCHPKPGGLSPGRWQPQ